MIARDLIIGLFETARRDDATFVSATRSRGLERLIGIDEIDRQLTLYGLREPFFSLSNAATGVFPYHTRPFVDPFHSCADPRTVLAEILKTGTTLILRHAQHFVPEVRAAAYALECERPRLSVEVNCYLTPPSSEGLPAHTDPRDTLLIQQHGQKRWRVWPLPSELQKSKPDGESDADGQHLTPPRDFTLRPGDMLLIPEGCLHCSTTQDEYSLHVTFGLMTSGSLGATVEDLSRLSELEQVI